MMMAIITNYNNMTCTKLITHDQLPSGLEAHLLRQQWSVPEVVGSNPTGVRDFFSFLVWAHFLSRASTQGIVWNIHTAFQLATFKPLYTPPNPKRLTCTNSEYRDGNGLSDVIDLEKKQFDEK